MLEKLDDSVTSNCIREPFVESPINTSLVLKFTTITHFCTSI